MPRHTPYAARPRTDRRLLAQGKSPEARGETAQAAYGKGIRDMIGPGMRLLFCGVNPGLYTAAVGHHFGRPGNRFWPSLHRGGFTTRQLSPFEED